MIGTAVYKDKSLETNIEDAAKIARAAVMVGRAIYDSDLDFTPGSMSLVDNIVESIRSGRPEIEEVGRVLFALGCYVGEVIVQNLGGKWIATEDTPMRDITPYPFVVMDAQHTELLNPIGRVANMFTNGDQDSVALYYENIVARHA